MSDSGQFREKSLKLLVPY